LALTSIKLSGLYIFLNFGVMIDITYKTS